MSDEPRYIVPITEVTFQPITDVAKGGRLNFRLNPDAEVFLATAGLADAEGGMFVGGGDGLVRNLNAKCDKQSEAPEQRAKSRKEANSLVGLVDKPQRASSPCDQLTLQFTTKSRSIEANEYSPQVRTRLAADTNNSNTDNKYAPFGTALRGAFAAPYSSISLENLAKLPTAASGLIMPVTPTPPAYTSELANALYDLAEVGAQAVGDGTFSRATTFYEIGGVLVTNYWGIPTPEQMYELVKVDNVQEEDRRVKTPSDWVVGDTVIIDMPNRKQVIVIPQAGTMPDQSISVRVPAPGQVVKNFGPDGNVSGTVKTVNASSNSITVRNERITWPFGEVSDSAGALQQQSERGRLVLHRLRSYKKKARKAIAAVESALMANHSYGDEANKKLSAEVKLKLERLQKTGAASISDDDGTIFLAELTGAPAAVVRKQLLESGDAAQGLRYILTVQKGLVKCTKAMKEILMAILTLRQAGIEQLLAFTGTAANAPPVVLAEEISFGITFPKEKWRILALQFREIIVAAQEITELAADRARCIEKLTELKKYGELEYDAGERKGRGSFTETNYQVLQETSGTPITIKRAGNTGVTKTFVAALIDRAIQRLPILDRRVRTGEPKTLGAMLYKIAILMARQVAADAGRLKSFLEGASTATKLLGSFGLVGPAEKKDFAYSVKDAAAEPLKALAKLLLELRTHPATSMRRTMAEQGQIALTSQIDSSKTNIPLSQSNITLREGTGDQLARLLARTEKQAQSIKSLQSNNFGALTSGPEVPMGYVQFRKIRGDDDDVTWDTEPSIAFQCALHSSTGSLGRLSQLMRKDKGQAALALRKQERETMDLLDPNVGLDRLLGIEGVGELAVAGTSIGVGAKLGFKHGIGALAAKSAAAGAAGGAIGIAVLVLFGVVWYSGKEQAKKGYFRCETPVEPPLFITGAQIREITRQRLMGRLLITAIHGPCTASRSKPATFFGAKGCSKGQGLHRDKLEDGYIGTGREGEADEIADAHAGAWKGWNPTTNWDQTDLGADLEGKVTSQLLETTAMRGKIHFGGLKEQVDAELEQGSGSSGTGEVFFRLPVDMYADGGKPFTAVLNSVVEADTATIIGQWSSDTFPFGSDILSKSGVPTTNPIFLNTLEIDTPQTVMFPRGRLQYERQRTTFTQAIETAFRNGSIDAMSQALELPTPRYPKVQAGQDNPAALWEKLKRDASSYGESVPVWYWNGEGEIKEGKTSKKAIMALWGSARPPPTITLMGGGKKKVDLMDIIPGWAGLADLVVDGIEKKIKAQSELLGAESHDADVKRVLYDAAIKGVKDQAAKKVADTIRSELEALQGAKPIAQSQAQRDAVAQREAEEAVEKDGSALGNANVLREDLAGLESEGMASESFEKYAETDPDAKLATAVVKKLEASNTGPSNKQHTIESLLSTFQKSKSILLNPGYIFTVLTTMLDLLGEIKARDRVSAEQAGRASQPKPKPKLGTRLSHVMAAHREAELLCRFVALCGKDYDLFITFVQAMLSNAGDVITDGAQGTRWKKRMGVLIQGKKGEASPSIDVVNRNAAESLRALLGRLKLGDAQLSDERPEASTDSSRTSPFPILKSTERESYVQFINQYITQPAQVFYIWRYDIPGAPADWICLPLQCSLGAAEPGSIPQTGGKVLIWTPAQSALESMKENMRNARLQEARAADITATLGPRAATALASDRLQLKSSALRLLRLAGLYAGAGAGKVAERLKTGRAEAKEKREAEVNAKREEKEQTRREAAAAASKAAAEATRVQDRAEFEEATAKVQALVATERELKRHRLHKKMVEATEAHAAEMARVPGRALAASFRKRRKTDRAEGRVERAKAKYAAFLEQQGLVEKAEEPNPEPNPGPKQDPRRERPGDEPGPVPKPVPGPNPEQQQDPQRGKGDEPGPVPKPVPGPNPEQQQDPQRGKGDEPVPVPVPVPKPVPEPVPGLTKGAQGGGGAGDDCKGFGFMPESEAHQTKLATTMQNILGKKGPSASTICGLENPFSNRAFLSAFQNTYDESLKIWRKITQAIPGSKIYKGSSPYMTKESFFRYATIIYTAQSILVLHGDGYDDPAGRVSFTNMVLAALALKTVSAPGDPSAASTEVFDTSGIFDSQANQISIDAVSLFKPTELLQLTPDALGKLAGVLDPTADTPSTSTAPVAQIALAKSLDAVAVDQYLGLVSGVVDKLELMMSQAESAQNELNEASSEYAEAKQKSDDAKAKVEEACKDGASAEKCKAARLSLATAEQERRAARGKLVAARAKARASKKGMGKSSETVEVKLPKWMMGASGAESEIFQPMAVITSTTKVVRSPTGKEPIVIVDAGVANLNPPAAMKQLTGELAEAAKKGKKDAAGAGGQEEQSTPPAPPAVQEHATTAVQKPPVPDPPAAAKQGKRAPDGTPGSETTLETQGQSGTHAAAAATRTGELGHAVGPADAMGTELISKTG